MVQIARGAGDTVVSKAGGSLLPRGVTSRCEGMPEGLTDLS